MNFIKKLLLYFSAFIPLYFLLLIKIIIEIINKNLSFTLLNCFLISFLIIFCGLGGLGIFLSLSSTQETTKIKIINSTNITENHFLGYFSLFVLFALSYEIEYVSMAIIFMIILTFIGIVYLHNNLFYINPLLNIIGFSFYSIDYKTEGSDKIKTAKVLYFGKLSQNKTYRAKLTDCNFNIVLKK